MILVTFCFVSILYFLTCKPHGRQKHHMLKGPVDDMKYEALLQEHEVHYYHYTTSLAKQILQLKKALKERRKHLQGFPEQSAVMLPLEMEELGRKPNSELEMFFSKQQQRAEIHQGMALPHEHALLPFESFTLHRVYQLETGLGQQPVQKALQKDLTGALEAALHILNNPQKEDSSLKHRIYSPRDFFEGEVEFWQPFCILGNQVSD